MLGPVSRRVVGCTCLFLPPRRRPSPSPAGGSASRVDPLRDFTAARSESITITRSMGHPIATARIWTVVLDCTSRRRVLQSSPLLHYSPHNGQVVFAVGCTAQFVIPVDADEAYFDEMVRFLEAHRPWVSVAQLHRRHAAAGHPAVPRGVPSAPPNWRPAQGPAPRLLFVLRLDADPPALARLLRAGGAAVCGRQPGAVSLGGGPPRPGSAGAQPVGAVTAHPRAAAGAGAR